MPIRAEYRGVVLMIVGVAFISANDAVSKYLAERYPLGEVIFLRQLAGLAFILPYALMTTGAASFKVVDRTGQAWRAVAFIATSVLMVGGLAYLPLAIVTAIAFSSPLWVAALAGPMLGEKVTAKRWIGILIGFAGVLIIVRPGGPSFSWLLLLPVATAIANAARDMITRKLSRTESSISVLLWSAMAMLVVSAAALPFGWVTPTFEDWLWVLLAGFLNMAAHLSMISAYRYADASALSPYRYTSLIWAITLGWLVWSHLPDMWSLVGTAVIVAAAVLAVDGGGRKSSGPPAK
jgi:drug/metabolite transporter (DMT)-like permease